MNKLLKPFALMFAVAISTGSFAQEGEAGKTELQKVPLKSYNSTNIVNPHKPKESVSTSTAARPNRMSKAAMSQNTRAIIRKQGGVKTVSVVR